MSLFLVYEIWSLWRQWETEEEDTVTDAEAVAEGQPDAAAIPAKTSGQLNATGVNGSLPAAATGPIDAILDKNPENLTDAELRQLVEAQGRIEDPSGRTNNPGGILYGTGPLKEHQIGSVGANANSSVRIAVYDTPENGIRAAMENWTNSRYYRGKSVREGLGTWSGGNGAHYARMLGSARPGYTGTSNPQTGFGGMGLGGMAGSLMDVAVGVGRAAARIATAASGGYTSRGLTESLNQSDKAGAIASMSSSISNMTNFGTGSEKIKENETASSIINALRNTAVAAGEPTVGALDPNYKNRDVVDGYLQYFNMKAA
jgi:peptidyl-tRNA hydrolase